jgi:hypothetical protein
VDEIKYPPELKAIEVPVAQIVHDSTRNGTKNNMEVTLKWECKVTESSSLSVADSFAYTIGFKALQGRDQAQGSRCSGRES